jgi:elongator complex protein 1
MYDVNPVQFLANISKFVEEVKQIDFLNLFINSLVNEESGTEL